MADCSDTCGTVETPSRLLLFYPDNTPSAIVALLPSQPICKPVGHHVTVGRSGTADVRLNDERMSRLYAALWHDGKDPFVFRVSNLSERKHLIVDGVLLRHGDEAEVKDGSVLTFDFLQFKAKVCAGDLVAFSYQVGFVKNTTVMSPVSAQPPEGKVLMPRQDSARLFGFPCFPSSDDKPGKVSVDSTEQLLTGLLHTLRRCSLDCGDGSNVLRGGAANLLDATAGAPDDLGVEYELEENVVSRNTSLLQADRHPAWNNLLSRGQPHPERRTACADNLSLNIPLHQSESKTPGALANTEQRPSNKVLSGNTTSELNVLSSVKKDVDLSCWFNLDAPGLEEQGRDVNLQDRLVHVAQQKESKTEGVCPSCQRIKSSNDGEAAVLLPREEVRPTRCTLPDMVAPAASGRRSPVENTAEWDTDDPSINCYM